MTSMINTNVFFDFTDFQVQGRLAPRTGAAAALEDQLRVRVGVATAVPDVPDKVKH